MKKITRASDGKWIAGVCKGIANSTGINPLIIRGIFIILFFIPPIGIVVVIAYIIAIFILPSEDNDVEVESETLSTPLLESSSSSEHNNLLPQDVTPARIIESKTENNIIYDPRIERLIDAAVVDGVLTDQEKQVLYKNASEAGYDLNEFEVYVNAKLFSAQKKLSTPVQKSNKYGDIRKCPNCGAVVETFTAICPSCGYAFQNVGTVSSFENLSRKLEALDNSREPEKTSANPLTFYTRTLNLSVFGDSIISKKAALITGWPVPSTKEDILEFLTMASPLAVKTSKWSSYSSKAAQIDPRDTRGTLGTAWYNKCKQLVKKARIVLRDDKEAITQVEEIAQQLKIK